MYGENDGLVAVSFAVEFHQALMESGSDALLELVEGARHSDMHDPDLVGDLIVTWLSRARGWPYILVMSLGVIRGPNLGS
jgi:hypothetical protein